MPCPSATTRDEEIGRNPHPPEGLRRDGPAFFVAPPRPCPALSASELREIGAVAPQRLLRYFGIEPLEKELQAKLNFTGVIQ